ncbi:MAG TPA: carbohydrate porin [Polyangiaceae bacterium]|nr:carbohydrate porin [Polyangiaceae bacterium]
MNSPLLRCAAALTLAMFFSRPAAAESADQAASEARESARDDDQFSVMQLLADAGKHDLKRERWNAYGQLTYISSWKAPFSAAYTNLNGSIHSLSPSSEHSFTATATLFLGVGLWPGAQVYLVPEVISSRPLSELSGLGASIQNFELQKQGAIAPTVYLSRFYLTQTINLGGTRVEHASGPMQLGTTVDSRRLLFAIGTYSILDFFDRNSVVGDPRRQLFNMAFLSHGAYDFGADARGYTFGALFELHIDDWAVRAGRFAAPKEPNQLELEYRIDRFYADQIELEHAHRVWGRAGVVRLLGYRNRENMGAFADAVGAFQADPGKNAAACTSFNYGSQNGMAPDFCWVRRPLVKLGMGVSFEQQVTNDVGVFARAMVSDGRTEVYSFVSSDRSASLGAVVHGSPWHRRFDLLGAAYAASWISSAHAQYLALGGIDGFIGDGALRKGSERVLELFYSLNVYRSLALSADYQHIANPAYNADRGPLSVVSGRVHAEF